MTEKRMKTIIRAELLDKVVSEIIQKLHTWVIIDMFLNMIDIEKNNRFYSLLNPDEYALARLKDITDDRLIEIAQHELDMDITQFTDIKIPKGVAMTALTKIAMAKATVAKIIEELVDRDKIEMFIEYVGGRSYMDPTSTSLDDRRIVCLATIPLENLLGTMQNDLGMDIKQFTDMVIPKSNEIKVVKKMEIVERVATELASRLKSTNSVDAFLSELGIDVSHKYERKHHSVKEHIIARIGSTNQEMYIKIAQEELEMDISDLLT